jgi:hypothetical protein
MPTIRGECSGGESLRGESPRDAFEGRSLGSLEGREPAGSSTSRESGEDWGGVCGELERGQPSGAAAVRRGSA